MKTGKTAGASPSRRPVLDGDNKAQMIIRVLLALTLFASNSLLCRTALGDGYIDAASFTLMRLFSGAAILVIIALLAGTGDNRRHFNPIAPVFLFGYAICFSFSYNDLSTATGALLLFGSSQLAVTIYAWFTGERITRLSLAGMLLGFGGLVYLFLPNIHAPSMGGAALMIIAGCAWAGYTLCGRVAAAPLLNNAWNFTATLPLALACALLFHEQLHLTAYGLLLATISGALASATGYAIWYSVLPALAASSAATVQLSVPLIAALGGTVFLSEQFSLALLISNITTLGGIYLACVPSAPRQAGRS